MLQDHAEGDQQDDGEEGEDHVGGRTRQVRRVRVTSENS